MSIVSTGDPSATMMHTVSTQPSLVGVSNMFLFAGKQPSTDCERRALPAPDDSWTSIRGMPEDDLAESFSDFTGCPIEHEAEPLPPEHVALCGNG